MKQAYFMISLLIHYPIQSKNDIDVRLQPLIDELRDLRIDGLEIYDTLQNETFACTQLFVEYK